MPCPFLKFFLTITLFLLDFFVITAQYKVFFSLSKQVLYFSKVGFKNFFGWYPRNIPSFKLEDVTKVVSVDVCIQNFKIFMPVVKTGIEDCCFKYAALLLNHQLFHFYLEGPLYIQVGSTIRVHPNNVVCRLGLILLFEIFANLVQTSQVH